MSLKQLAQQLRAIADELDAPAAITPITSTSDGRTDWGWNTSDGPDPLAKYYQTEEGRNVLMHQFDHYLMTDPLHGEAIPFTDERWFPKTIQQYGSMETYLQVMQEKTGRSRAEIGDIMRGILLVTKVGVRAWWAQYFATAPAG